MKKNTHRKKLVSFNCSVYDTRQSQNNNPFLSSTKYNDCIIWIFIHQLNFFRRTNYFILLNMFLMTSLSADVTLTRLVVPFLVCLGKDSYFKCDIHLITVDKDDFIECKV